jgi:hypothetical protein
VITLNNLSRLHAALRSAGVLVDGVDITGSVTPTNLQTAAQPIIDAFDGSASAGATYAAQQEKANATSGIDNGQLQVGDKQERLIRALALVVLDEINILRAASVPTLTARTTAQLVSAIKAKIAATDE